MKHSWNNGIGKDQITKQLGWVCINPLSNDAIFFDNEYGECELQHITKEQK